MKPIDNINRRTEFIKEYQTAFNANEISQFEILKFAKEWGIHNDVEFETILKQMKFEKSKSKKRKRTKKHWKIILFTLFIGITVCVLSVMLS